MLQPEERFWNWFQRIKNRQKSSLVYDHDAEIGKDLAGTHINGRVIDWVHIDNVLLPDLLQELRHDGLELVLPHLDTLGAFNAPHSHFQGAILRLLECWQRLFDENLA